MLQDRLHERFGRVWVSQLPPPLDTQRCEDLLQRAARYLSEAFVRVVDRRLTFLLGVGGIALASIVGSGVAGPLLEESAVSEAASALVNLGYNPSEALGAVARVAAGLGENAEVEALIRGGLGELAPAEAKG